MKRGVEYETDGDVLFLCNLLRGNGIAASEMRQCGDKCRFTVSDRDGKATERVLNERNKRFRVVANRSLSAFVRNNASRVGLYVGAALVIALLYVWSSLVTEVKVKGAERVEKEKILAALGYEGSPVWKRTLDLKEKEKALVSVDGVSNAALLVKGNVLYVEILEELDPPDVVEYAEDRPVVSSFDGIVTKVVCYAGTPVVQAGDTVRKGDVLIASYTTLPDGSKKTTRALGDVYGRVWVTETEVITPTVIRRERTGRSVSYVFGGRFTGEQDPPFDVYDAEETTLFASPIDWLRRKRVTYYEVTEREERADLVARREEAARTLTERLESKIPETAERVRTWFLEKTVDKNVLLVVYYEIIVKLSD